MTLRLLPPRVPFLDDRTKLISREWYRYLERIQAVVAEIDGLPAGQIWIGDATNFPAPKTVSGDGALSLTGVFTLQPTANVNEIAQDAVGGILANSSTITFNYSDSTPSISASAAVQMSIAFDAGGLKLVNDEASPGNSEYYGTNAGGTKGYFPIPSTDANDIRDAGYWSPLMDATDPLNPEFVFTDGGDTIAVWTAT